jgi:uroporphyrinogen decarboxylase
MSKPLLLQAFDGTNTQVPVWFMRQAGRYLPEYRALKEKYSLEEMFHNPELAATITCQPMERFNLDAAILFADILTLPTEMGFLISFDDKKGPQIGSTDAKRIHDIEDVEHIRTAIQLTKNRLPKHIPLIGFAGSPFTVLTYLIEGGSSINFTKVFKFMAEEPKQFHELMERLTKNTVTYLNLQKKAGIDVFQLFDSWGGILRPADYAHFVLPYVKRIFKEVDLPSIYYLKNCSHLLSLMDQTDADFLSVCHTVVLGHHVTIEKTKKGIQGNLFNGLLYADHQTLKKEIHDVLIGAQKHERFIFNLSHGIFPDVNPEIIQFIIDEVHAFPWAKS